MRVPSDKMLALANARLVAHQGGWDEIIVLVAPVLLFAVIRLLEKRRRPPADETAPSTPDLDGADRVDEKPAQPARAAGAAQQPDPGR